ncbi:hypothetical protein B0T14DRAFT_32536 [Immersiella caudata]|uniref:Uncharacterized protein n=1 Tax=Immersiella caudata TaxID=314043 RepID=A0AA39XEC8_9PEZI|nr:hypothetical protein B0T14DRAFT_32536 [Immersiella caudata]
MSEEDHPPALKCAQNIALLSLFSEIPGGPCVNLQKPSADTSDRVLSFKRELRLSDSIALIASVSDDKNHIVASCVEELPERGGVRILVAINKAQHNSAESVLLRIKHGFEKLFSLLSEFRGDDDAVEGKVFDAVVEMCRQRLLARVGLVGGKSLASPLQQALSALENDCPAKMKSSALSIVASGKKLLSLLQKQDHHDTTLRRIIENASHLAKRGDLPKALDSITKGKLDPSIRTGLVRRLKKLSLYQNAAHLITQSAKSSRIFEKVSVVPVSLDAQWFARTRGHSLGSQAPCCLIRFGATEQGKVATKLRDPKFPLKVETILTQSKIHAEVQLIAYLELNPSVIKPRVISSSKAACYLCNLFIQLHGKYHVHQTHGKLYTGWRIPQIPALMETQARLTAELARVIKTISSSSQKHQPQPIESPAPTISTFMSTVLTLVRKPQEAPNMGSTTAANYVRSGDITRGSTKEVTAQPVITRPLSNDISTAEPHGSSKELITVFAKEPSVGGSANEASATAPTSVKELLIEAPSVERPLTREQPTAEPLVEGPSLKPGSPVRVLPVINSPAQEPFTTHTPPIENLSTDGFTPKDLILLATKVQTPVQPMLPKTTISHLNLDTPAILVPGSDLFQPQLKSPKPHKTIRLTRGFLHTHRLDITSKFTYAYTTGLLTINPTFIHATSPAPTESHSSSSSSWPSFPESSSESSQGGTPVEMRIRWLPVEEEAEVLEQKGDIPGVTPVEEIPNVDIDSGKKDVIYLQYGNHIVELLVVRGGKSSGGSNDAVVSAA